MIIRQHLTVGGLYCLSREKRLIHLLQDYHAALASLSSCQVPIIVALSGIALRLAVDVASSCDIRFASEDTIFGIVVDPACSSCCAGF